MAPVRGVYSNLNIYASISNQSNIHIIKNVKIPFGMAKVNITANFYYFRL